MHRGPPFFTGFRRHALAHIGVRARQLIHALSQGLGVKHRASGDNREGAARRDVVDEPQRIRPKVCRRITFVDVANVDQMMRTNGEFLAAGLGGSNVHAAVDESRVHRNDLHRMPPRERERQSRLAARGGPQNHERAIRHHCPRRKSLSRSLTLTTVQVGRP